jgi:nucleotide-binding universal stress UspA family protein
MNEMLKVLIPTDFTVQSEFAYLMVKNLQSAMPVEIHFLHVLAVPDTVSMDSLGNIQTCGEIDVNYVVKQRDIAQRNLDNLQSVYGNQIHTHLALGKLTDQVIRFAEEGHYDLIVMGTKGAWGLKEKLSGSETQMIARRSRVPLLSLMCDRSDLKIKNILMVHNFSSPANENLNLLHKFIKAFDAQVHFLQITSGDPSDEMTTVEGNMAEFAAVNKIENYLCHLIKDSDIEGGVVHFNQMNNMDILCIGTHGKAGIFHQSATEKLINHLFKPIISFQLTNS